jgi:hypothetical protein
MIHPKLKLTVPWESIDLSAQQQIIRVLAMPELERSMNGVICRTDEGVRLTSIRHYVSCSSFR